QVHCQSRTSPCYNQSFVKELAKPTQEKKKFKKMPHSTTKDNEKRSNIQTDKSRQTRKHWW
ncbi:MAG: hypothetical protein ACK5D8_00610, partial [Bacteroidota bacterium]